VVVRPTIIDRQGIDANAAAAVWSGDRVWKHVRSEFLNDIDPLMETVATGVPLQYAVPAPGPSGALSLVTVTTRDGARRHYEDVRQRHDIADWQAFVELRSEWCVFFEGVVTQRVPGTGELLKGRALVLFVLSDQDGITGELAWSHEGQESGRGSSGLESVSGRLANLEMHRRYTEALAAADIGAVLDLMSEEVEVGARSYVVHPPAFVHLDCKAAVQREYEQFFDRYQVRDVSVVNLVADDWYVYSELLWEADLAQSPNPVRFRTAEMMAVKDGCIRLRLGYGTDPV
jgi:hypothetical protein